MCLWLSSLHRRPSVFCGDGFIKSEQGRRTKSGGSVDSRSLFGKFCATEQLRGQLWLVTVWASWRKCRTCLSAVPPKGQSVSGMYQLPFVILWMLLLAPLPPGTCGLSSPCTYEQRKPQAESHQRLSLEVVSPCRRRGSDVAVLKTSISASSCPFR